MKKRIIGMRWTLIILLIFWSLFTSSVHASKLETIPKEVIPSMENVTEDKISEADEEYALTPRVAGDITMYMNGEIRQTYHTIAVGDTRTARVEVEGESIDKVEWSSNDTSILVISGDRDGAVIEARSVGVTSITADITTDQGKKSKDLIITTRTDLDLAGYANEDANMHQAADESSNVNRNIEKGDTLKIQGQSGKYYWVSYDDATGFVLKNKVEIPAEGLALNQEYVTIRKNEQETVLAVVSPELYTGTITWNSQQADVAAVGNNGKITGIKEGAARIYAEAESMNGSIQASVTVSVWTELANMAAVASKNVNGKKGAVSDAADTGGIAKDTSVTVIGRCGNYYYIKLADGSRVFAEKNAITILPASITLNAKNATISKGKTYQLTAKVLPELAADKSVVWSSKNSNVASVNANGLVKGLKKGATYIVAKTRDKRVTAECKVTVLDNKSFKTPTVNSVEVFSVVPDSHGFEFSCRANANFNKMVDCALLVYTTKKKKIGTFPSDEMPTNTEQEYSVMDLEPNTKYYARIRIDYEKNGVEKEKYSPYFAVKTTKPQFSLSVKKAEQSDIQLQMEKKPKKIYGITSYQIRYREKGSNHYKELKESEFSRKGDLLKIKKKIPTGKTYIFEVRMYQYKKLSCKNTVQVRNGYTAVKATQNSKLSKITVSWGKINEAKGYEIYRSEKKGKRGKKIADIKNGNTTKYVDAIKNLKNAKTYYYQVRPYWKEKQNKKLGSSNQAGILCRRVDPAANKKVLLDDLKLKGLVAAQKKVDMDDFRLTPAVTGLNEAAYPAVKYQFDGKKLTIHLYIQYSSYRFQNQFLTDGTARYTPESIGTIRSKTRSDGKKYVNQFQKGLVKYLDDKWVQGTKEDFGKKVNFKTALVIHRKDDSMAAYHEDQQFIEVMIGGINPYRYTQEVFSLDANPYWYHAMCDS